MGTSNPPPSDSTKQHTFLGLEPADCRYEDAAVVLLPVPYDGTASYREGARHGPAALLAASTQVELWDVELEREPWQVGVHVLPAVAPSAAGPEAVVEQVRQACLTPAGQGKLAFTLGGEHTVAVGGARAAAEVHGELSILQIDAHLDLRQAYDETPYSHACTARRLLELGRVVPVGVRAACPEELDVVRSAGLDPVWGHQVQQADASAWIQRVLRQLGPKVYVTLDVDGLDPAVMPATGTPVPGGLGWYQTLALLREVGARHQVVGCDLCELAPIKDQPAADFTAALLAYKMIGYFTRDVR